MITGESGPGKFGRIAAEFLVIFVGVTAAFFIESYREDREQREDLLNATAGIVTELTRYETRGLEHVDSIVESIDRWKTSDRAGEQTVPAFYRIPGAPLPPTAAWDAAVSSGVASLIAPDLRIELGYFYTEFVGIHQKYSRYAEFVDEEILPRAEIGPAAFYDSTGALAPPFKVHMDLLAEFAEDLRELTGVADDLGRRLEALGLGH
ncbi:hypothetical protein ACFL3S_01435 [Gemmatimonadota bacterium]